MMVAHTNITTEAKKECRQPSPKIPYFLIAGLVDVRHWRGPYQREYIIMGPLR